MKNSQKGFANIILIGVIVVLVCVVGYFAFKYVSTGTLGSASCGSDFDSWFRKAVADNNPNFCLTFDFNNINQYKNLYGYYYCKAPQAGSFDNDDANGISRDIGGNVLSCLEVFALQTHNSQSCTLAPASSQRDTCFVMLADRTGNKDYCNSVVGEMDKQDCLSY